MALNTKVFLLEDEDFSADADGHYFIITSALSDHKMVYRLNNFLGFNLQRTFQDHHVIKNSITFNHVEYQYYDQYLDRHWVLLGNSGKAEDSTSESTSLFSDPLRSTLLPAKLKVDFILRLTEDTEQEEIDQYKRDLNAISGIITANEYIPTSPALKEALHVEIENIRIDEQS